MSQSDQKNARKKDLLEKLRRYQQEAGRRGQARLRSIFRFSAMGATILFFAVAGSSHLEREASHDSFLNLCTTVKEGTPIEAMRGLASERRLDFKMDEQASAHSDDGVYLLRPSASWPSQFSCRFRLSADRLYRLR